MIQFHDSAVHFRLSNGETIEPICTFTMYNSVRNAYIESNEWWRSLIHTHIHTQWSIYRQSMHSFFVCQIKAPFVIQTHKKTKATETCRKMSHNYFNRTMYAGFETEHSTQVTL